jgi:ABC-type transporter Mla maintaining outer membrane lipid asymmetry permease subunit MlaE
VTCGFVGAALGTLSAMVFIMSANVTRDIVKLWRPQTSDKSLIRLGYVLIALFLFLPFYWTLENPPALLAIFMGFAAMGLGAIFFFVTVVSYYWRGATKLGAILTVIYGTVAALWGGWAVLGSMVVTEQIDAMRALGTDPLKKLIAPRVVSTVFMVFFLTILCDLLGLFGGSLVSSAPSTELLNKLFPGKAKVSAKPKLVLEQNS